MSAYPLVPLRFSVRQVLIIVSFVFVGITFITFFKTCIVGCGRRLVWTRTSACHADDPGSNPGGRTKNFTHTISFNWGLRRAR